MVVKPLDFIARGRRGLVQPALKTRGREYLRIIYGPEYDLPENLDRLRARGLSAKRSLALREFALGIEALERFVRREPLRRVHECVFGVLALRRARVPAAFLAAVLRRVLAALLRALRWVLEVVSAMWLRTPSLFLANNIRTKLVQV